MPEQRAERIGWWSLRVRITSATTAIVLVVLAAGAVGLVGLLRSSVVRAEATTAEQQAAQIAAETQAVGRLPPFEADEVIIQLQREGRVVAVADDDFAGTPALPVHHDSRIAELQGRRWAVASSPVQLEPGVTGHVVVGRSLKGAGEATRSASWLLGLAVPAVSLFVAALTWTVVGRSLRPVEQIRSDVENIGNDGAGRIIAPRGQDEVARLAVTMNRMLERLEKSRRAQQRFVSDASHELRSPVAAIRQHAQVALLHPETVTLPGLAEVVDAEAARLEELVSGLLLLARVDERSSGALQEIDLDDLVLAEGKRLRALGTKVDLTRVGPARVLADPALMSRAVRNAAENARRHARSAVAFELTDHGTTAVLRVDDDGPGVPEEDRERVFHRFERRDDARDRDSGGAGLGLAIIAEAARQAGGSARLETARLGGARLEMRLPSAADQTGPT
ncbi:HAMP domain-containing histidine kinase [Kineosporia rhizophila]|uniref:sensor histidine kinase n=1 Tax=Kineosporia TaxID=49184 RepID=UPI001E40AC2B|nr:MULTISPECIES: HAMP domain-containing sensor histidine kinase [Kineosporia]MCE0536263.1 HAMP domain-containing histidine kinase [Kineosporia rhizophila]GLY15151.1 two-component sensor histidine kinase [Kineosporia sp. NBRC 101677]